jgi:hypothetical protein
MKMPSLHIYPHLLFLLILCTTRAAFPFAIEKELGRHSFYAEFEDPYYICTGFDFSLSKNPIPTLDTTREWPVYHHLLTNMFIPNCFLMELSAYPLPLAGVAARAWAPTYYNRAQINGVNMIRALTESVNFKEPWSVSAFVGHMVHFKGADNVFNGHGNIGLLGSYGYYHIKDNGLIPDHWLELEAKIKVDKRGNDVQYATSYRIGTRLHSEEDIKDLFYVGIRRDRTDFKESGFSFIKNTCFQVRPIFSFKPLQAVSLTLEAGKKYPFTVKKKTFVLGLSLGVTWNINNPYSGRLAQGFTPGSISPLINPVIRF